MNEIRDSLVCIGLYALALVLVTPLHCLLSAGGSDNDLILLKCAALLPIYQANKRKLNKQLVLTCCFVLSFSTVAVNVFFPGTFRFSFCGPIGFAVALALMTFSRSIEIATTRRDPQH